MFLPHKDLEGFKNILFNFLHLVEFDVYPQMIRWGVLEII